MEPFLSISHYRSNNFDLKAKERKKECKTQSKGRKNEILSWQLGIGSRLVVVLSPGPLSFSLEHCR